MPKPKDWKKGTFRIKLEVITDVGARLDYYMPWVPVALGEVFIAAATIACDERRDKLNTTQILAKMKQWIRDLAKAKKEAA